MCFSPAASFTAAALLVPLGAMAVVRARRVDRRYVALAARLLSGESGVVVRPSGRVARLVDWFDELNRELVSKRLRLVPVVTKRAATAQSAASLRNSETVAVDWAAFWDWYAVLA